MSLHVSNVEAESEAIRIAEAFISADIPEGSSWDRECGPAAPHVRSPGYKQRKTVVKWIVGVRWIPKGGGVFDGANGMVLVDIVTKEVRWAE